MPEDIVKAKQLLVEGKDTKAFFESFLEALYITDIQIQDFRGNSELPYFLGQLAKNSNFRKSVTSLGIVRDAEESGKGAFQSVQSALRNAQLPAPTRPNQATNSDPKINIFILPDENSSGMLETLLLRAVSDDPAMSCINEFMTCMEKENSISPKPLDKARALAFLASRKQIKPLIGHAARAGYWNFKSTAYTHLIDFINSL